jgi:hypothetical protein
MANFQIEGEIYFLRERSLTNGELSPVVKIGLVNSAKKRDSFERLSDHQTGNPRRLELREGWIVKTLNVNAVESLLHHKFAEQRVRGEWFEVSSYEEFENYIREAHKLADEMSDIRPVFENVESLSIMVSNGEKIPASESATSLAHLASLHWKKKSKMAEILTGIKAEIISALAGGVDLGKDTKKTSHSRQNFDEIRFRREQSELYEEFAISYIKSTFNYTTFRNKVNTSDDSSSELFEESLKEISRSIEESRNDGDLIRLIEIRKLADSIHRYHEWEMEKYEARLKIICGKNLGIEGIVTWKRNKEYKLDKSRFETEYPELAAGYTTTSEISRLVVAKGRLDISGA